MIDEKQTYSKLNSLKGCLQEESSSINEESGEIEEKLHNLKERRKQLENGNLEKEFQQLKVEIDKKLEKKDIDTFIEWLKNQYT